MKDNEKEKEEKFQVVLDLSSKIKWHCLGLFFGKYHQLNNLSLKGTIYWDQTKIPSFCFFVVFSNVERKGEKRLEREGLFDFGFDFDYVAQV